MSSFTLEQYRIQREYRQNKRKQFLKRFQLLKQKLPLNNQSITKQAKLPISNEIRKVVQQQPKPMHQSVSPIVSQSIEQKHKASNNNQAQLSKQIEQNNRLKKQLQQIQVQERKKLLEFKQQISTIKEKYIEQIKNISTMAQKNKTETDEKMKKIVTQMQNAIKKNQEIKAFNQQLKKQLQQTTSTMGTYSTQIKNQYSKKVHEFQKIFNTSNEKIQQMQRQFKEDQFVENALNNEQLLQNIQQNASKSQQAVQILSDYRQLLAGKSQILVQLNANIKMKESQLVKMNQLEGKMKVIFEKMNAEKKGYLEQNQRMTKELIQIKDLIMGFVNQSQQSAQN